MKRKRAIFLSLFACLTFLSAACGKGTSDKGDADVWQEQDQEQDRQQGQDAQEGNTGGGDSTGGSDNSGDISGEGTVIYSWDNSRTDAEPKSGSYTGDWDNDGEEDLLKIETEDQEGSEVIKRLELCVSGWDTPYVLENQDNYFIDMISGDFDADSEPEILLLFDMRYAGANGCLGIRLLDRTDSGYVALTEECFSGFAYSVDVRAGKNGSYVISRDGGNPMTIGAGDVSESAIGTVTGFYALEVLQGGEGTCRLRIKQYVAGADMTDHVGDVVSVLAVCDGQLTSISEETTDPKADLSDSMESGMPVSLAEDMLAIVSVSGDGQWGDGCLEIRCPDGILACPSPDGGLYFFRDGIYCGCLYRAEFDGPYDTSWQENPEKCGTGAFSDRNASWKFLYAEEQPQRCVYAGERAVYSFGDSEFLQEKGILTADEVLEETAHYYAALIVESGEETGYYMEVSSRLLSAEEMELLLQNMTLLQTDPADASAGYFTAESAGGSGADVFPQELPQNDYRCFEAAAEDCALDYEIVFQNLQVRVPEGTRGLRSGDGQWLIYDNYDSRSEVGYARGVILETPMSAQEAVLTYGYPSGQADAAQAADSIVQEENGTCSFTCRYEIPLPWESQGETMSQPRTRKIWIDGEGKYLLLLDLCGGL